MLGPGASNGRPVVHVSDVRPVVKDGYLVAYSSLVTSDGSPFVSDGCPVTSVGCLVASRIKWPSSGKCIRWL